MDARDKIIRNDALLRKVVRVIEKSVGEDIHDYIKDNRKETNNALKFMPSDNINDNLRNMIVKDDIELIPFTRTAWDGRILVDRTNHITYTITTARTLSSIPRKKGRSVPHYLQSILYVENGECKAPVKQMNLADYGITMFYNQELEDDYNKIVNGHITPEENYRHYIIVYESERGEVTNVELQFLDKDFDVIECCSLNDYIKPDFAKLTAPVPIDKQETNREHNVRSLISVKGVKPQIRKEEKNQEA